VLVLLGLAYILFFHAVTSRLLLSLFLSLRRVYPTKSKLENNLLEQEKQMD